MKSLCFYPSMTFYCPCKRSMVCCIFLVGVNVQQSRNVSGGCQTRAERHTCDAGMRRRWKNNSGATRGMPPRVVPAPSHLLFFRLCPNDGTRSCTCVQGTENPPQTPGSISAPRDLHVKTPTRTTAHTAQMSLLLPRKSFALSSNFQSCVQQEEEKKSVPKEHGIDTDCRWHVGRQGDTASLAPG